MTYIARRRLFSSLEASPQPWKTLLEPCARAAWRVATTDATSKEALQRVLQRGHSRQHQPAQQRLIQHQHTLAARREKERRMALSEQPLDPKRKADPLIYGPPEALASLAYRFTPSFAVTKRVLEESRSLTGYIQPRNVIDFGIGCASASLAAASVWPTIDWVHGIDASSTMHEAAATLWAELGAAPRLTLSSHLSAEHTEASFDLALFAYTAVELPHAASTLAAAALLWEKIRPGGLLVMIEPGTPDGFQSVRTVRNMLLDCCPTGSEDACHLIAPCTHTGRCPMEGYHLPRDSASDDNVEDEKDGTRRGFCSFVQTMPGSAGKGEKFSYLVAQKRSKDFVEAPNSFHNIRLDGVLQKALAAKSLEESAEEVLRLEDRYLASDADSLGLELLQSEAGRSSFGRIIQAPIKRRGHVFIDCCADGRVERYGVSKSMSVAAPGIYTAARKSRWGGFWPRQTG